MQKFHMSLWAEAGNFPCQTFHSSVTRGTVFDSSHQAGSKLDIEQKQFIARILIS